MFDTQAIKENFGRAARAYDEHATLQRLVRAHCVAQAQKYWRDQACVLDAGCGTGALAREANQWRVTSLDVSPGMCKVAGRAVNADASAMPFVNESFDGVFSSLMLQWADEPQKVLSEMVRVMKPQSHAVLSTLTPGTLQELRMAFSEIDAAPHVSDFLPPHLLLEHAEAAGFSLVVARQAVLTEHYPDAIALMRALQAIGATNKQQHRRRGLMTPRQFSRLEAAYEGFRVQRGLPATWQVLYLVLKKG